MRNSGVVVIDRHFTSIVWGTVSVDDVLDDVLWVHLSDLRKREFFGVEIDVMGLVAAEILHVLVHDRRDDGAIGVGGHRRWHLLDDLEGAVRYGGFLSVIYDVIDTSAARRRLRVEFVATVWRCASTSQASEHGGPGNNVNSVSN